MYSDYLEDTIYCADRTINSLAGFNPNGGTINGTFINYGRTNGDLSCSRVTDMFSVSNSKAKLKYPVGLATKSELDLTNLYYAGFKGNFLLISPYYYEYNVLYRGGYALNVNGNYYYGSRSDYMYDLRPEISLKPGTGFISGNGSMDTPYVVYSNPKG